MKKLSTKDFLKIYQKVPRVTVDIVIKDRRGVLLIKREINPEIGKWHLPGGTVYFKERILDAVKRKGREETGLQIKIKKFLGVFEFVNIWKYIGQQHVVDLIFLAEPIKGILKGNSKYGGKTLKFFKKLPKNMMTGHREILEGKLIK